MVFMKSAKTENQAAVFQLTELLRLSLRSWAESGERRNIHNDFYSLPGIMNNLSVGSLFLRKTANKEMDREDVHENGLVTKKIIRFVKLWFLHSKMQNTRAFV